MLNQVKLKHQATIPLATKLVSLDLLLNGGLPRGTCIELFGEADSCKSSLSLYLIKRFQEEGLSCAYIDSEFKFNSVFAKQVGVNTSTLLYHQGNSWEVCKQLINDLFYVHNVDFIVLDSLAGIDITEFSSLLEFSQAISSFLRDRLQGWSRDNKTLLITNQKRVDVHTGLVKSTGGKIVHSEIPVRIMLKRLGQIAKDDTCIGSICSATIYKSKITHPTMDKATLFSYLSGGISPEADVFYGGLNKKIVSREGNLYIIYSEGKRITLGAGREEAIRYLHTDSKLFNGLYQALIGTPSNIT